MARTGGAEEEMVRLVCINCGMERKSTRRPQSSKEGQWRCASCAQRAAAAERAAKRQLDQERWYECGPGCAFFVLCKGRLWEVEFVLPCFESSPLHVAFTRRYGNVEGMRKRGRPRNVKKDIDREEEGYTIAVNVGR